MHPHIVRTIQLTKPLPSKAQQEVIELVENLLGDLMEAQATAEALRRGRDIALARVQSQTAWTGTVKMWNDKGRYGFIVPDDNGDDLFVHGNSLVAMDCLRPGAKVIYERGSNRKGPEAQRVRLL